MELDDFDLTGVAYRRLPETNDGEGDQDPLPTARQPGDHKVPEKDVHQVDDCSGTVTDSVSEFETPTEDSLNMDRVSMSPLMDVSSRLGRRPFKFGLGCTRLKKRFAHRPKPSLRLVRDETGDMSLEPDDLSDTENDNFDAHESTPTATPGCFFSWLSPLSLDIPARARALRRRVREMANKVTQVFCGGW